MSSARPRNVRVSLGERSYPVRIGTGLLDGLGELVARRTGAHHAVLITVPGVGRRYGARALRSLRAAGLRCSRVTVPDGDASKNLAQAAELYAALLAQRADRGSALVALGGGMVGDLTGYVAATFLRGIPFVQVPTTVLAMVDASVGGKTGVNLPEGKNLVGAFHQPAAVLADVSTLRSLPARERAAGFAEVVKAASIWDSSFFARLERRAAPLLRLEEGALIPTLERAVRIKAEVVGRDEREQDLRMLLNFGHSMGHAVETLEGYRGLLHGEAVSIGMVYASRLSETLGVAEAGIATRLTALCTSLGLPVELPGYSRLAYRKALGVDKKRRDDRIHYVVLERIGAARTQALTPAEIVALVPRGGAGPKPGGRRADSRGGTRYLRGK
ncbi:MAG: 3-dehydroquinate synthase [Myxococcales bacterium]|nr:3-dehydroquinate synthase [Myxococcales bacterium]